MRVANELGAGNGKAAKFATIVAVVTSVIIGLFFWVLIMSFHNEVGYIFTNSRPVLTEVNKLSLLLAFTILLNSVQPVLSGNVSVPFLIIDMNHIYIYTYIFIQFNCLSIWQGWLWDLGGNHMWHT